MIQKSTVQFPIDMAGFWINGADTAKLILEQAFSPDYGFPAHYEAASSANRTLHHAWLQVDRDLDFSDCQHDNEDYYSRCSICGEEMPHICDDDCRSNGCTEKGYSRRECR